MGSKYTLGSIDAAFPMKLFDKLFEDSFEGLQFIGILLNRRTETLLSYRSIQNLYSTEMASLQFFIFNKKKRAESKFLVSVK